MFFAVREQLTCKQEHLICQEQQFVGFMLVRAYTDADAKSDVA